MLEIDNNLKISSTFIEKAILTICLLFPIILLGLLSFEHYLEIGIILGTIFLILIFQNYRYGLYFIVIGLPMFQSLSMRSDSASSTGVNLQYLLIPVVFTAWLFDKISKKELSTIKLPFLFLFTSFLAALMLSIINQMDFVSSQLVSHGFINIYALANYMIFFYIIINETLSKEDIQKIFWGFIIVAFIIAVIGIFQYFLTDVSSPTGIRVTSIFESIFRKDTKVNPNVFGTYLAFMTVTSLLVWNTTRKRNRIFIAIFIVAIFIALLLSFSRSSLLALIFSILCYTFYRSKKAFVITILLAAAGLVALYFEPTFHRRINSIVEILSDKRIIQLFLDINPENLNWAYVEYYGIQGYNSDIISGAFRIWAWIQGINLFWAHPVFGIGYHLTPAFSPWATAENLFLDFASMTGIVGLSLFITLIIIFIRDGFRLLRSDQFTHYGMFWLNVLAVAFFVSLTGSILFSGKLLGVFFILAGMFYNIKKNLYEQLI